MEESALIVRGLCRQQGKFELRDISFTLPRGYIMGLVGRMGSGKTTLLKSILNPSLIKSGSVEYEGQAGFIMEDAPFFIEATLKENMELFKNLYIDYDEKEFYDRLRSVGLEEHKVYGLLSKGEKVRFQFAFAMGHHPELLLLDEPTSGLDVVFHREFLYMLQEAVEKQMVSVIFSTHLTDELERIADFIGVMDNGTLTMEECGSGETKELGDGEGIEKLKRDTPDFKGVSSFCRGVYLKSSLRFAAYVICFLQFMFGWIIFLTADELRFVSGFMSGLVLTGIMFQYIGQMTKEGAGKKVMPMRVGYFFGVKPWLLWRARIQCMLKSSWCFAAVALVQCAAVIAITGNGGAMFAILGIFVDYVIVAALTAAAALIMC